MKTKNGKYTVAGFVVALSVCAAAWGGAFAQELQGAGTVPVPKDASLSDTHTTKLGSYTINSKLYFTAMSLAKVVNFYKAYFEKEGYTLIIDSTAEKPKRLLRFKKDTAVVSIALRPKGNQTQIVVGEYSQPFGALPPEKTKPNWKDLIGELPAEDQPGQDLKIVPRPPESVRIGGGTVGTLTFLVYHSRLGAVSVSDFYQEKMPALEWGLREQTDMQKATEGADAGLRKKMLNINLPFPDITLDELTRGGSILAYRGEWGDAEISVLSSGLDGQGSLVYIKYVEKIAEK